MNHQWNKRVSVLLATCTFASLGYAQKMINGTVKDQEGEPLIGVNISTNENTGTITDAPEGFDAHFAVRPIPQQELDAITNKAEFTQNEGYE